LLCLREAEAARLTQSKSFNLENVKAIFLIKKTTRNNYTANKINNFYKTGTSTFTFQNYVCLGNVT
jgi:hypothetical protein